jgi:smad nuclear-interacting protein 1
MSRRSRSRSRERGGGGSGGAAASSHRGAPPSDAVFGGRGRRGERVAESAAPLPSAAIANYSLSGALAADGAGGASAASRGSAGGLKFSEPAEARVPTFRWHLHVFKGGARTAEPPIYINKSSATLFGRDRAVADVPCDHPSCSGQHAVIQFRLVAVAPAGDGLLVASDAPARTVKPYLLDLESTNGTFLNGRRVEPARYIELRPRDVLRMGTSSREFVLLYDEMAKDAR